MKARYYALIFMAWLYFFSPVLSGPSSYAWLNGPSYAEVPSTYLRENNYGTHDYIAETALVYIFTETGNPFLAKIVSNDRLKGSYFLAGTDAPDLAHDLKKIFEIPTECGYDIKRTDIYPDKVYDHKLRLKGFTLSSTDTSLIEIAEGLTRTYERACTLHNGQFTAYILGAICHVIADATFFTHLKDGGESWWWDYARDVQKLTSNALTQRGNDFISTAEAQERLNWDKYLGNYPGYPGYCVELAAREVYYPKDAVSYFYIDQMFTYSTDLQNQWDVARALIGKPDPSTWNSGDWAEIQRNPTCYKYFKTVEHHINVAIIYCGSAIFALRDWYKGDDCQPEEKAQEAMGQPPSLSDQLKQMNRNFLNSRWPFFGFTVLASYLGTIMIIKAFAMKIAEEWATKLASFLIPNLH